MIISLAEKSKFLNMRSLGKNLMIIPLKGLRTKAQELQKIHQLMWICWIPLYGCRLNLFKTIFNTIPWNMNYTRPKEYRRIGICWVTKILYIFKYQWLLKRDINKCGKSRRNLEFGLKTNMISCRFLLMNFCRDLKDTCMLLHISIPTSRDISIDDNEWLTWEVSEEEID